MSIPFSSRNKLAGTFLLEQTLYDFASVKSCFIVLSRVFLNCPFCKTISYSNATLYSGTASQFMEFGKRRLSSFLRLSCKIALLFFNNCIMVKTQCSVDHIISVAKVVSHFIRSKYDAACLK